MNADPTIIDRERIKRNLMADQPKEVLNDINKFFKTAIKEGIYAPGGGSAEVAKSDIEFYVEAGQMKGPAESLKIEDFWYLAPVEKARKASGK
jgi:NitT/TauT family transport system substrate-binding protein